MMNYDDYIWQRVYQEESECTCSDHCELCDDEECECDGHQEDCGLCQTTRGCRCDQIYDEWRDQQNA